MDINEQIVRWELWPSIISALALVAAVVVAWHSTRIARNSTRIAKQTSVDMLQTSRYVYLANKWYDLKEREFQHPIFADETKTSTYKTAFKGNVLRRYELFAWMSWGHIEDVFLNNWHNKPDFEPSIRRCKELHYQWLLDNRDKFDLDFLNYIEKMESSKLRNKSYQVNGDGGKQVKTKWRRQFTEYIMKLIVWFCAIMFSFFTVIGTLPLIPSNSPGRLILLALFYIFFIASLALFVLEIPKRPRH